LPDYNPTQTRRLPRRKEAMTVKTKMSAYAKDGSTELVSLRNGDKTATVHYNTLNAEGLSELALACDVMVQKLSVPQIQESREAGAA
jgi:hypothetical protein